MLKNKFHLLISVFLTAIMVTVAVSVYAEERIKPDVIGLDKLTPGDFHYGFEEWNLPSECFVGDIWQAKEKVYVLVLVKNSFYEKYGLKYAEWVPVN